jgi:hypothetical protein
MENIAKFLETSLKEIKLNTLNPQYRLRTLNIKSNLILLNYLERYPLFGTKYLDFMD